MRLYYAADNTYSTSVSSGFANTWYVLAFSSRAFRDEYVASSPRLATRDVTKREALRYLPTDSAPVPFSGQFRAIVESWEWENEAIPGCVGSVETVGCYCVNHGRIVRRFH